MAKIMHILIAAKRQITCQRLRDAMLWSGSIGGMLAALVLLASMFFPIYYDIPLAMGVFGVSLVAGAMIGWFRRPTLQEAAGLADHTGLSEHLVTALERKDKEDVFSKLQRKETWQLLQDYPMRERLKKPVSRKNLGLLAASVALAFVFAAIPTKARALAQYQHELNIAKDEQVEKLAEELEKLEELAKAEEPSLTGLEDLEEAVPKELAEKLREADIPETLREEMKETWKQMLSEGQQELQKAVTKQEMGEIARRLEKKEEQMKEALELAQAEQMERGEAGQLQTGNLSQSAALSQVSGQIGTASTTNSQLTQAGESPSGSQSDNKGSQNNSGNGSDSGQGNNSGNNNGSGQGNGSGSGNGSGQGNGSGHGVGSGTGEGWNRGSSVGIEREHTSTLQAEMVLLPGQTVESENLTGSMGQEGSSYLSQEQVAGAGYAGTQIEYEKVVGEYSEKAYSQIERNEIPAAMQDVVKNYFSGLGQ